MRTTIALDDELIRQAEHYTGIKEKAALVRDCLLYTSIRPEDGSDEYKYRYIIMPMRI